MSSSEVPSVLVLSTEQRRMCKWFDKHFKLVINEDSDISSQDSRKMEKRGPDYNCLRFVSCTEQYQCTSLHDP